jgi:hypothetical protein
MQEFNDSGDLERDPMRATRPHFPNAIGSQGSSSNSKCYCAEQFEAMVKLGVANSRMKDFCAGPFQQARVPRQDPQRSGSKNIPESRRRIACEQQAARPYARILRQLKTRKDSGRHSASFCVNNASYMAKTEFNTVIKTLKIFLVPVVAAVHGTTLFSLQWKPAVLGAE